MSSRELDPIPLFESGRAETAKGKLLLQVRITPLQEEFGDVPKTTVELHRMILLCRQRQLEAVYRGILAYLKVLKDDPKFYRKFNCGTIDEYHIKYGLGSGDKLGKLIALVKLFEQKTFVLVGDQLLNEMILGLVAVQESASGRKRDFQRIFDRYCERHPQFDREAFRMVIREYIAEQYPPPKARPTPSSSYNPRPTPVRHILKPMTKRTDTLVPDGPDESSGHRVVEIRCSGCELRDSQIKDHERLAEAYERYSQDLLKVIRGELKMSELVVPREIKVYRKQHGLSQ